MLFRTLIFNINCHTGEVMAKVEDIAAALGELRTGIQAMKQRIADLEAGASNGGDLNGPQEQELLDQIRAMKDETNPTPTPTPPAP